MDPLCPLAAAAGQRRGKCQGGAAPQSSRAAAHCPAPVLPSQPERAAAGQLLHWCHAQQRPRRSAVTCPHRFLGLLMGCDVNKALHCKLDVFAKPFCTACLPCRSHPMPMMHTGRLRVCCCRVESHSEGPPCPGKHAPDACRGPGQAQACRPVAYEVTQSMVDPCAPVSCV